MSHGILAEPPARVHRFQVYAPKAHCVHLHASFLDQPRAMAQTHDGWWSLEAIAPAGESRYYFLIDGLYSAPDFAAGEPEYDDAGRLVSVLRIDDARDPARRRDPARIELSREKLQDLVAGRDVPVVSRGQTLRIGVTPAVRRH